jgi:hypothetical protein
MNQYTNFIANQVKKGQVPGKPKETDKEKEQNKK